MNFIKTVAIAFLLLGQSFAYAANGSVTGKVTHYTQWSTALLVQVDTNNSVNPASCSSTGYYTIADTKPQYKYMKTMLLAAKLNGDSVRLVIYGAGCLNNRPRIVAVRII